VWVVEIAGCLFGRREDVRVRFVAGAACPGILYISSLSTMV